MKIKISKSFAVSPAVPLAACLMGIGIFLAWVLAMSPSPVQAAQVQPFLPRLQPCLSNSVNCGTVSTTLMNAAVVTLQPGRGCSIALHGGGTQSTNTGLLCVRFAPAQDGTNYATQSYIDVYATAQGVGAFRAFTNLPASLLDNARTLKAIAVTNAFANTNSTWITNLTAQVIND